MLHPGGQQPEALVRQVGRVEQFRAACARTCVYVCVVVVVVDDDEEEEEEGEEEEDDVVVVVVVICATCFIVLSVCCRQQKDGLRSAREMNTWWESANEATRNGWWEGGFARLDGWLD